MYIDGRFHGNCWGDIVLTLRFQVTSPLNARGKRFMPTVAVEGRVMTFASLFYGFNPLNMPCSFMFSVPLLQHRHQPSCESPCAHYHFLRRRDAQRRVSARLHVQTRAYNQHGCKFTFKYYTEQIYKPIHARRTFSKHSMWQIRKQQLLHSCSLWNPCSCRSRSFIRFDFVTSNPERWIVPSAAKWSEFHFTFHSQ